MEVDHEGNGPEARTAMFSWMPGKECRMPYQLPGLHRIPGSSGHMEIKASESGEHGQIRATILEEA